MIGNSTAGAADMRAPAPSSGDEAAVPRTRCGTVSILLIDDRDADSERIARALAANRDYTVEVDLVSDAQEASRLWRTGLHDVVIFDIWLGNKTCVDLFILLAAEAATRPVIILSNLPNAEARALSGAASDLTVHSKDNLSPAALGMTLGSALALARHEAERFDA